MVNTISLFIPVATGKNDLETVFIYDTKIFIPTFNTIFLVSANPEWPVSQLIQEARSTKCNNCSPASSYVHYFAITHPVEVQHYRKLHCTLMNNFPAESFL